MRHRFCKSFVLLAMALQVLNMSIDPVDSLTGVQDIAINEIESCVELIVEVVLDKQNGVQETDEADDSHDRHIPQVVYYACQQAIETEIPVVVVRTKHSTLKVDAFFSPTIPIISPPPKQS